MNSSMPSEYAETINILQKSIERLEAENAELRLQLEAGFQEAVKQFSDNLQLSLEMGYVPSQYSTTHSMGLGPN